jgi:hypothetical protein
MKKIKILLTAITVLTVVGGALAFKAAKFSKSYCTKSATGQCTSFATQSKIVDVGGSLIWAIETSDTDNCTKTTAPNCGSQIRLESELGN